MVKITVGPCKPEVKDTAYNNASSTKTWICFTYLEPTYKLPNIFHWCHDIRVTCDTPPWFRWSYWKSRNGRTNINMEGQMSNAGDEGETSERFGVPDCSLRSGDLDNEKTWEKEDRRFRVVLLEKSRPYWEYRGWRERQTHREHQTGMDTEGNWTHSTRIHPQQTSVVFLICPIVVPLSNTTITTPATTPATVTVSSDFCNPGFPRNAFCRQKLWRSLSGILDFQAPWTWQTAFRNNVAKI